MTQFFPSPVIPAGLTVLAALSLGYLPAQTQVTGFGTGATNPTVAQLVSSGLLSLSAPASTLTFSSPETRYGGA